MTELRQRPAALQEDSPDFTEEEDEFTALKTLLQRIIIKKYKNKHIRRRAILYISSGSMFLVYLIYTVIVLIRNQPVETVPAFINTDAYKPKYLVTRDSNDVFGGTGEKSYYLKRHRLDKIRSDSLPLNRQLEDYRPTACKIKPYLKTKHKISIIIVLDISPPSVIMRMILSAIQQTKSENLAEIVIMAQKGALDISSYVWKHDLSHIVRVITMPLKKTLSSSRNEAASYATGDILVFLPEAVEILPGWAEPLLEAMSSSDRGLLAGLSMDEINAETFEQVEHVPWHLISIPRWDFTSAVPIEFPEHERARRQLSPYPDASLVHTPVLQFIPWAADKVNFLKMGGLDEGMIGSTSDVPGDIIELSLRWWNCGGEVAYLPCSKVAIVSLLPDLNSQEDGNKEAMLHNSLRTARRWAGSYKNYYHEAVPRARNRPGSQSAKLDNIINSLSCHSLDWYINSVAIDWMFGDKVARRGAIQAANTNACIDHMGHDGRYSPGRPRFYNCHGGHSQTWVQVASSKQIQTETGKCLMSDQYWHDVLTLDYCKEGHVWKWEPVSQGSKFGYLIYKDLCLEYRTENNLLFYVKCTQNSNQQFIFEALS